MNRANCRRSAVTYESATLFRASGGKSWSLRSTGKRLLELTRVGKVSSMSNIGLFSLAFEGVSLAGVLIFLSGGGASLGRRPDDLRFSGSIFECETALLSHNSRVMVFQALSDTKSMTPPNLIDGYYQGLSSVFCETLSFARVIPQCTDANDE